MRGSLYLFFTAAAAGLLAGWGVGGGTLLLVCLTLLLGTDHRTAQAVNLLFFLSTAGVSLLFHGKKGYVDKAAFRAAALPAAAAALCAAAAAALTDSTLLRKPFGIVLLWTGISMLWSARKG